MPPEVSSNTNHSRINDKILHQHQFMSHIILCGFPWSVSTLWSSSLALELVPLSLTHARLGSGLLIE